MEVLGLVTKEVTINTIDTNSLKNTFALDVTVSFPGYYGELRHSMTPDSVVLVSKTMRRWETILRKVKKVNSFLELDLNGAPAEIFLWNSTFYGIRLKNIPKWEDIPIIQNAFKEEGFEFHRKKRVKNDSSALITVKKFFNIKEVAEGIYLDIDRDDMAYIDIPQKLNWEHFRKMTLKVKNNISNNNFDVIDGLFFKNKSVQDMIRVYKPQQKIELLEEIKKSYLYNINKYK